jgi:hypothetical protein
MLKKKQIVYIVILMIYCIFGCNLKGNKVHQTNDSKNKTLISDTLTKKEFGYRFSIVGDFNGDKQLDTIFESYISNLTHKETFKIMNNEDWENNIDLVMNNQPITRLYTSIPNIDTFIVTKEPQQIGLMHYRNLGDINEDGNDEIGYAVNWADYSNLNTYHILSLRNKTFEEIFTFPFNESILYHTEEKFVESSELVKYKGNRTILYQFISDSATLETGEHSFK